MAWHGGVGSDWADLARRPVEQVCEAVAEQAAAHAGELDREGEPSVGDGVAVGAADAFDQAVQAQPASVVGQLSRGHGFGWQAE
jgi:hypothetical protein